MEVEIKHRLVVWQILKASYIAVIFGGRQPVQIQRYGFVQVGRVFVCDFRARYQLESAGEPDDCWVVIVGQIFCDRISDCKHRLIICHSVVLDPYLLTS